jgi:hypothetical protein
MTLQVKMNVPPRVDVKVNNMGGVLTPQSPITLKNAAGTLLSIEQIGDVDEVDVVDGATLVYNSATDKYEIKRFDAGDLSLDNIDGGTF